MQCTANPTSSDVDFTIGLPYVGTELERRPGNDRSMTKKFGIWIEGVAIVEDVLERLRIVRRVGIKQTVESVSVVMGLSWLLGARNGH